MNTWSPLFSSVVESSLWDEPLHVRVLFMTLLALKEQDQVVRKNEYQLRRAANIEGVQVAEALKILSRPDRKRPNQEHEGRRIKEVADGWLILNGELYEKQMRRVSKAIWARKHRMKQRSGPTSAERTFVKNQQNGVISD